MYYYHSPAGLNLRYQHVAVLNKRIPRFNTLLIYYLFKVNKFDYNYIHYVLGTRRPQWTYFLSQSPGKVFSEVFPTLTRDSTSRLSEYVIHSILTLPKTLPEVMLSCSLEVTRF